MIGIVSNLATGSIGFKERIMYVVTRNNPYYPSVDYFESWEEAEAKYASLCADDTEDGSYNCKVSIGFVMLRADIKTAY
jgi:hypothetical protein